MNETILAGIDGCPKGWICVTQDLSDGKIEARVFNKIDEIRSLDPIPKVIAIDIPIGLPDSGTRQADEMARQMLKRKASSVFPAPIRHVLAARDFAEANTISRAKINKGMSIQSWSIVRKIREVDDLLRNHPQLLIVIFEVHPELSFLAMNGDVAQAYGKKKKEGRLSRQILVNNFFGQTVYESIRNRFKKKDVSDDDICDAFAALWSAQRIHRGLAISVPNSIPRDLCGLPMVIWY